MLNTGVSSNIHTHFNMETLYVLQGRLVPAWHLLHHIVWVAFPALGSIGGTFTGIFTCKSMSALLHCGESVIFGRLGVEHFWPSFEVSSVLCISCSCASFSSHIQVSCGTGHRSIQTSNCTLLDGDSLASHCFQHIGMCSSLMWHCKKSHQGCFSGLGDNGSSVAALYPLVSQRHELHKQGFSSSAFVWSTPVPTIKVYQQCWK